MCSRRSIKWKISIEKSKEKSSGSHPKGNNRTTHLKITTNPTTNSSTPSNLNKAFQSNSTSTSSKPRMSLSKSIVSARSRVTSGSATTTSMALILSFLPRRATWSRTMRKFMCRSSSILSPTLGDSLRGSFQPSLRGKKSA